MRVILQEKVTNLGNVGEQVSVKPGFARNFLLPQGKAVVATAENLAEFEKHRAELEKAAAETLSKAKARAQKLESLSVKIAANAGEEGKLFGSIGARDVAEAITAAGIEVEKREVHLPEGPIRQIGDYQIQVQLHSDVIAMVKVSVVAE